MSRLQILSDAVCCVIWCAVNGAWSEWSTWSACSMTCGPGSQERIRTCDNPAPQFGGNNCTGEASEETECQEHECPGKLDHRSILYYALSLGSDFIRIEACFSLCLLLCLLSRL